MSTSTITGKVTPRCYAAPLQDCDGGPTTGEHWVTQALLERIRDLLGPEKVLGLEGHPRFDQATTGMLQAKILCAKHNEYLSDFDSAACSLFDALLAFHRGRGHRATIHGDHLERWFLKVLAGNLVVGVSRDHDGAPLKQRPGDAFLRKLFHEERLAPGGGLRVIDSSDDVAGDPLSIRPMIYTSDHPLAGEVSGIRIDVLGVMFVATLGPFDVTDRDCIYRPAGFAFGTLGRLDLTWNQPSGAGHLRIGRLSGVDEGFATLDR